MRDGAVCFRPSTGDAQSGAKELLRLCKRLSREHGSRAHGEMLVCFKYDGSSAGIFPVPEGL